MYIVAVNSEEYGCNIKRYIVAVFEFSDFTLRFHNRHFALEGMSFKLTRHLLKNLIYVLLCAVKYHH